MLIGNLGESLRFGDENPDGSEEEIMGGTLIADDLDTAGADHSPAAYGPITSSSGIVREVITKVKILLY